jgi:hypothetical protein
VPITQNPGLFITIKENMKKTADDNSYAKISEDSVEIFGQVFPLERPYYYESGELESFAIKQPTIINYKNREITIGGRIWLRKNGKFHGTVIDKGYTYKHKGQLFKIGGGIEFYESGNLEGFYIKEMTETDFIVDGKKLVLYKGEQVIFYEESGLPKTIKLRSPAFFQSKEYNVIELSETGEITNRYRDGRWDYDYD